MPGTRFSAIVPMQEAVQRRRCGKTGNPLRFEIQKIPNQLPYLQTLIRFSEFHMPKIG